MGNLPPCPSSKTVNIDDDAVNYIEAVLKELRRSDCTKIRTELTGFDIVFLLDNCAAMELPFKEQRSFVTSLLRLAACYDQDGFDFYLVHEPAPVKLSANIHQPKPDDQGLWCFKEVDAKSCDNTLDFLHGHLLYGERTRQTNLSTVLGKLLEKRRGGQRKTNFIVFTAKCDEQNYSKLAKAIKKTSDWISAEKKPQNQLGIQFVQIGHDEKTMRHLTELDSGIDCKIDIVDSTTIAASTDHEDHNRVSTVVKILLGGIVRRIDANGTESLHRIPWLHRKFWVSPPKKQTEKS